MRHATALALVACAVLACGGCATRHTQQGSVTEEQSGKELQFFRYEGEQAFGLQEAGTGGRVIAEPAWSRYVWGGGVIYVQPVGAREWVRILADGKPTDDRWDSVACYGGDYSVWLRRRGDLVVLTDLALKPATLRHASGPARSMLDRAQRWTKANLANIGTQGGILRIWRPLDELARDAERVDAPAADKAWFFETYALASNLATQTYYHTEDLKYTNSYFGGYVPSLNRVIDAYAAAIRLNAGADQAMDARMRRARLEAAFALLSYDREPVRGQRLEQVVEMANEDLAALEADPANAGLVQAYTAELQKLIAKRGR